MIPSELPDRPWQKVAADLVELKGHPYLLVIDYFFRYIEVAKLLSTTSPDVTTHLQSMFARHGIPEQLISDNGPQFSSTSFAKFAEDYGFTRILTSPRYPQAIGEVERAVQTVKNLLKKTSDPYKALMAYRATPLESGLSPADLLMGRKIRTRIPTSPSNLNPSWPYLEQFRENDASLKGRQKRDSDRRHLNRLPETLNTDTSTALSSPPPDVQTATSPEPAAPVTAASTPEAPRRTTRSGREIRTPERFKDL